jgi:hypothetical protein
MTIVSTDKPQSNWWIKTASLNAARQFQYAIYNSLQNPNLTPQARKELENALKASGTTAVKYQYDALKRNRLITPDLERLYQLHDWYGPMNEGASRTVNPRPYIVYDPNAADGFGIRIRNLKLPTQQELDIDQIKYVWQQMGGSMKQSGNDLLIQSDLGAWRQFVNLIPTWFPASSATFMNAPVAIAGPELKPSGKTMETLLKGKRGAELPKMQKVNKKLVCLPIPDRKNPGKFEGIAVNFDPTDPVLNGHAPGPAGTMISDGLEDELRRLDFFNSSTAVRAYFNEMKGQVLFLTDFNSPTQWDRFNKLIAWFDERGYNTSEILSVLSKIAPGKYESQVKADDKAEVARESTPEEIQQSLVENVKGASVAAAQYLVRAGVIADPKEVFNPKNPLEQQTLFQKIQHHVRDLYPNGFRHGREEMGVGQAEAIAFGVTRDSFILADEPGSGKTFMAAAIADLNRRIAETNNPALNGQGQILVLTPGGLIRENWMPKVKDGRVQPSAPKQFIDPHMDESRDIQIIDDYGPNGEVPDFTGKWVVIPYDMFRPLGDPKPVKNLKKPGKGATPEQIREYDEDRETIAANKVKLARQKKIQGLINKVRKNKRFTCCIMDESQNVKNDQADSTANVHHALSSIAKKVSMTGTPSDDNPKDFYGQLQLIDHPAIRRGGDSQQSLASFCRQYFAGYGTSDKMSAEDLRQNVVEHMGSARRFMDMICNFFLRRTKDQINPFHRGRHDRDNLKMIDENGQPFVPDEHFWGQMMHKAQRTAAENKVLVQMYGKNKATRDVFGNILPEFPVDEARVQDVIRAGLQPQEKQQALLIQVAMKKAYTTAQQAIDHITNTNGGRSRFDDKVKDEGGGEVMGEPQQKMRVRKGPNGRPLRDADGNLVLEPVLDANGQPLMENKPLTRPKEVPNKVLILTGSVPAAHLIRHIIAEKTGDPSLVATVVGGTKDDERGTTAVNFQNAESNPRILIFTVKLGAVGYNFDVADLCIVNDPPWNPSLLEQGVNRVDRSMGKYKPTIIYNVLSNDPEKADRRKTPQAGMLSIDDLQYQLIDSKGEANNAVQNCLQEAAEIRKAYAGDPMKREEALDQLAERFVLAFADSLDAAEQARLFYNPPRARETGPSVAPSAVPVPVAARSWYKRFKTASFVHRNLW